MSVANALGDSFADSPMRKAFLRWQCRVRQTGMRDGEGRPNAGIMPAVCLGDNPEPMGHIITVLNKAPGFSQVPELTHIHNRTFDPSERRRKAVEFLSASYYQRGQEFSDILTATFPPDSSGAQMLRRAGELRLVFDAFGQVFDMTVRVWKLSPHNTLYQATMAHNRLFNPALPEATIVLGFEPDWLRATATPEVCRA